MSQGHPSAAGASAAAPTLGDWRGRFPWPLGAPSWVLPLTEDNLVGNVAYLAQRVDFVELQCLGLDYVDDLLPPGEVERLAAIQAASGLGFSVHLPSDAGLLSLAEQPQELSATAARLGAIVGRLAPLRPRRLVLHLDPARSEPPPPWLAAAGPAADQALDAAVAAALAAVVPAIAASWRSAVPGAAPAPAILIENTGWDLTRAAAALAAAGVGVCADFGHLYHHGHERAAFLRAFAGRLGQLHLHGFGPGGDHLELAATPPAALDPLLDFLASWAGPVTIENFDANRLEASLTFLAATSQSRGSGGPPGEGLGRDRSAGLAERGDFPFLTTTKENV